MDLDRHPLEKLKCPLVLKIHIESRRIGELARKGVLRNLGARGPVQVNNDVQTSITGPPAQLLEIRKPAVWKVLAVVIDEILVHPVADGYANRVQTVASYLFDVLLGNP